MVFKNSRLYIGEYMILIEYINIIFEDADYIICFQTSEGVFHQKITNDFAQQLGEFIKDKTFLYNDYLNNASIDTKDKNQDFCVLSKPNGEMKTVLHTLEPSSFDTWQEGLLIALNNNMLIFLDKELLISDYVVEAEHELFVSELIDQAEKFHKSSQIKNVIQNMALAASEERYEDAKKLKEKLESEARKHNVNGCSNEQTSTKIDNTESTNIKK